MEQLWLFFSLLSLVTGFGLLVALLFLRRLAPVELPPIVLAVSALLLMGIASFFGVYLRLIGLPRSILPYRLVNAAAWGYAPYALLRFLLYEGRQKVAATGSGQKRAALQRAASPAVGVLIFGTAFLAAHPGEEGLLSRVPGAEAAGVIAIELLVGLMAIAVGIGTLRRSRRTGSRPWRSFFRGFGIALLILIPANLLDFGLSTALQAYGYAARDGFVFAAGYGLANIILIYAIVSGIRLSSSSQVPAVPQPLVDAYGISKREREVIEKLLEGKNDRQIAEELYISPRTVDSHLRSIYRKCDINSRLRLSRLVADYGKFRNS